MKSIHFAPVLLTSALLMVGAGCNPDTDKVLPTPTPAAQVPQSEPEAQEVSEEPVAVAKSTSTIPTPPPVMPTEKLAFPGVLPASETTNKTVHIKTAKGEIVFELLPKEGPNAASNFVYLAKQGFYDGLIFHRVEPGFVIQGGDPMGQGFGGPGYQFKDDPVNLPYSKGIVAMANAGPNTNGSQFFIMLGDTPLPPSYSIFGRVVSGQEVVDKIKVGDKMETVTVQNKK